MVNHEQNQNNYISIRCKTACNPVRGRFPYRWDLNIYRGCDHGCRYCFAMYTDRYMVGSDSTSFFRTVYKKENIAEQLEKQLSSPKWNGDVINLGGITDNYQPWEAENGLMTQVLEILLKYRNPCIISTKSDLILRDFDLIDQLSRMTYVNIASTITCTDQSLAAELEPGAVHPDRRFAMLKEFSKTNAVTGVHSMPLIPLLTDNPENLESLYNGASHCGAKYLLPGFLYLKGDTRQSFFDYLFQYHPQLVAPMNRLFTDREAYKQHRIPAYREIRRLAVKYRMTSDYMKEVRRRMNAGKSCFAQNCGCKFVRGDEGEQLDFFSLNV